VAAWLTYVRERFSLPVHLLVSGGFAATGAVLGTGRMQPRPLAVSFVGIMVFFALLRLMDEDKDLDKDRIAHSERPLPRGLLDVGHVRLVIRAAIGLMAAWSLVAASTTSAAAGAAYASVTVYLWLMYREFYVREWLQPRPLLYAVAHQLILIPLSGYSVFVASSAPSSRSTALGLSLLTSGAFFAYEVCRKLDPAAHPILRTYLHVHGRAGVFAMVAVGMLVAAVGARMLAVADFLWPIELGLVLSLIVIWLRPTAFKIPEAVAGLSLLAHLWAVPVQSAVSSL
jgi:4-hydroxybenzoate polyprenyltransferase